MIQEIQSNHLKRSTVLPQLEYWHGASQRRLGAELGTITACYRASGAQTRCAFMGYAHPTEAIYTHTYIHIYKQTVYIQMNIYIYIKIKNSKRTRPSTSQSHCQTVHTNVIGTDPNPPFP